MWGVKKRNTCNHPRKTSALMGMGMGMGMGMVNA